MNGDTGVFATVLTLDPPQKSNVFSVVSCMSVMEALALSPHATEGQPSLVRGTSSPHMALGHVDEGDECWLEGWNPEPLP